MTLAGGFISEHEVAEVNQLRHRIESLPIDAWNPGRSVRWYTNGGHLCLALGANHVRVLIYPLLQLSTHALELRLRSVVASMTEAPDEEPAPGLLIEGMHTADATSSCINTVRDRLNSAPPDRVEMLSGVRWTIRGQDVCLSLRGATTAIPLDLFLDLREGDLWGCLEAVVARLREATARVNTLPQYMRARSFEEAVEALANDLERAIRNGTSSAWHEGTEVRVDTDRAMGSSAADIIVCVNIRGAQSFGANFEVSVEDAAFRPRADLVGGYMTTLRGVAPLGFFLPQTVTIPRNREEDTTKPVARKRTRIVDID